MNPDIYTRKCARCDEQFSAVTRTELFTLHACHLRLVHFPEWGTQR